MNRRGVTLMEMTMGILIGSLLILSLTRLFSGGLRLSQKGTSHLTNIQTAAVLMQQIEDDFAMATEIPPISGSSVDSLQLMIAGTVESVGKPVSSTVIYNPAPGNNGYLRILQNPENPGAATQHTYCQGLNVQVSFENVASPETPEKRGFFVHIQVKSPTGGEETNLKRFVYGLNLPGNRNHRNGNWNW